MYIKVKQENILEFIYYYRGFEGLVQFFSFPLFRFVRGLVNKPTTIRRERKELFILFDLIFYKATNASEFIDVVVVRLF